MPRASHKSSHRARSETVISRRDCGTPTPPRGHPRLAPRGVCLRNGRFWDGKLELPRVRGHLAKRRAGLARHADEQFDPGVLARRSGSPDVWSRTTEVPRIMNGGHGTDCVITLSGGTFNEDGSLGSRPTVGPDALVTIT